MWVGWAKWFAQSRLAVPTLRSHIGSIVKRSAVGSMSVPQSSPGTPSVLEGLACDSPASSVVYLIEDSPDYDSDPFCIGPGVWRRTHVRAEPILANPLDTDAAVDTDPFCVTPACWQPSPSSARSFGASTEEIVSALPTEPAQQSSTVVSARSEIAAARDAFF